MGTISRRLLNDIVDGTWPVVVLNEEEITESASQTTAEGNNDKTKNLLPWARLEGIGHALAKNTKESYCFEANRANLEI